MREGSSAKNHAEEGASAVEYALLVTLIALAIFGGVLLLGSSVAGLFSDVANTLP